MTNEKEIVSFAGEADSERRRRRHRRRSKKKEEGISPEAVQLVLRWTRWGIGFLAMLATWTYGLYVADKLGWTALVFLPAGFAAMICVEGALAIPIFALIAVVVAFVLRIDSGPLVGLLTAGVAFTGVGGLFSIWRLFVFFVVKREVSPTEAGYK